MEAHIGCSQPPSIQMPLMVAVAGALAFVGCILVGGVVGEVWDVVEIALVW